MGRKSVVNYSLQNPAYLEGGIGMEWLILNGLITKLKMASSPTWLRYFIHFRWTSYSWILKKKKLSYTFLWTESIRVQELWFFSLLWRMAMFDIRFRWKRLNQCVTICLWMTSHPASRLCMTPVTNPVIFPGTQVRLGLFCTFNSYLLLNRNQQRVPTRPSKMRMWKVWFYTWNVWRSSNVSFVVLFQ